MKIGIFSLGLGRNYGGILQQYALAKYMESLGHEVVILNRQANDGGFIKRTLRKALKMTGVKRYNQPVRKEPNIDAFNKREFSVTDAVSSPRAFNKLCKREKLDAIVYGSDQVWRRDFELKCGLDYFGASTPASVKQIAYAPSFGLDVWEYTPEETKRIKDLVSQFKAVSCREALGSKQIKDNLALEAPVVCDPTMLLTAQDYSKLASERKEAKDYCFVYWLGDEQSMNKAIEDCVGIKGLEVVAINLRTTYPLSGIEDWLSLIKNANYVITDSFHGTVFSLLFNKQFFIHCNRSGGFSRLETLLKRVGAESKLTNPDQGIDYNVVNKRVNEFRSESQLFLTQALSR